MSLPKHFWTDAEQQALIDCYPNTATAELAERFGLSIKQIYTKATHLGLKKSAEFLKSENSGRIQRGRTDPRMAATQFKKGLVPWNKGVSYMPGGRCKDNHFKPGHKPSGTMPLHSYRVTTDTSGRKYLEQKISDAPGPNSNRWKAVHRIVWESVHGTVQKGCVVVFRSGAHSVLLDEITVDRLECITRAELAKRNHPRSRNPELGKLIQLKGAITRQVNRITRENNEQRGQQQ